MYVETTLFWLLDVGFWLGFLPKKLDNAVSLLEELGFVELLEEPLEELELEELVGFFELVEVVGFFELDDESKTVFKRKSRDLTYMMVFYSMKVCNC